MRNKYIFENKTVFVFYFDDRNKYETYKYIKQTEQKTFAIKHSDYYLL